MPADSYRTIRDVFSDTVSEPVIAACVIGVPQIWFTDIEPDSWTLDLDGRGPRSNQPMASSNTQHRIVKALQRTDEPAMSAKQLANALNVSVHTVNKHTATLVDNNRVATTQIGNATAFYIADKMDPTAVDHVCDRCGRAIYEVQDFALLSRATHFDRNTTESGTLSRYILCRFCYSDFVSWFEMPDTIGEYPFTEIWDVPEHQLDNVKNPDTSNLGGRHKTVFDLILQELDEDDVIAKSTIVEKAKEHEMLQREAEEIINTLCHVGYLRPRPGNSYEVAPVQE